MTPREKLVMHTGDAGPAGAEELMRTHKVKKLPLVNADGTLRGLITAKDLIVQRQLPFATRDGQGRLRVGAAIGAKGDYLERAAELLRAEVDVLVIDIAHGHSAVMARAIEAFRKRFGDVELIAGNVATADGVRFLLERGVDGIKVGIGPGGGCTTRLNTNFGVPQVQALVECRAAADGRVPLIADGGVKRHGAFVQALMFGGDTVMLGGMLAGTAETPGEVVQKPVVVPDSQQDRERAVQGVPRDGVARGDRRSARRGGRRSGRRRSARRGGHGSQRAGSRVRETAAARHPEAPLFGDQLRRRAQPRRDAGNVSEGP